MDVPSPANHPWPTTRRALVALVLAALLAGGPGPAWASPRLRAVSLRALQSRLRRAADGQPPAELLHLGGLTRLAGYLEDRPARDLILLGEVEPGAPPLHTEDLVIALRAAWGKYARRGSSEPPGCSIDPDPAVLRQLDDLADAAEAGAFSGMEEAMERWSALCGQPQQVRVMGVPRDSRFARVMVEADYLMKQVVDGSVALDLPGFISLTDARLAMVRQELEQGRTPSLTGLSLNRFWFYPGPPQFVEAEGVVGIERCPVVLLTEEERLTRAGLRGRGRPDPLAGTFARSFTSRYCEIAARQPVFRELENLFRHYAVAQALRYRKTGVDLSYLLTAFPVSAAATPRTLPGLSRVGRLVVPGQTSSGLQVTQFWMPSCGGVSMDYRLGPRHFRRVSGPGKGTRRGEASSGAGQARAPLPGRSAVLRARPAPDALFWDLP